MGWVPSVASNVVDKAVHGGVADLTRMPRTALVGSPDAVLYRYDPAPGVQPLDAPPVLLVPPLGAPDFAYDLRRGCSLVEHLVTAGRTVYLVAYGRITFADRRLGMEHWVDDVVPRAVRDTCADSGAEGVDLLGWSLGGIFCMLAAAADPALPVHSLTVIGSPVDIAAVPLVAPLRPLAELTGGHGLSVVYQAIGSFPAPVVSWIFQLTAVDKLLTKPLTILSRLDDRDCLAQIEAVDHLMNNMHGYPGRVFGQIYHLLLRSNDLAEGTIDLAGRTIALKEIGVPVLVVGGENDVIAPLAAVERVAGLLTGSPEVRFHPAPGGHLGVLTGRRARTSTWTHLDRFLTDHATPAGRGGPPAEA
ncbi:alpha/beta hydrolase [Pseudonocardia sp.]|uniref:alpha/beta hydrolase n=1 Tax=Pseudonocardia sp. TaxID=60912 RepID=UPI00262FDFEC|nr:alpha/beta hydrolase [Pseudonocardia sp.]